jgi:hypothetical protein
MDNWNKDLKEMNKDKVNGPFYYLTLLEYG